MDWPRSNYTYLNSVAAKEINSGPYDGIGIFAMLPANERASFVEHENLLCEDRLMESHVFYYGNTDYFHRGKAGLDTGLTSFSNDGSLSSGNGRIEHAIMAYHYPPQSTCESQTIDFNSSPQLMAAINATFDISHPINSAAMDQNIVLAGFFPSQFS